MAEENVGLEVKEMIVADCLLLFDAELSDKEIEGFLVMCYEEAKERWFAKNKNRITNAFSEAILKDAEKYKK